MVEDTDGVGEAFEDSLRIALTVASQMGERLARLREQSARRREAARDQEYRELADRFAAERAAARAQLAPVMDPSWWATAGTEDISDMHRTATEWRKVDPTARQAAERIRTEVRERYGIDINSPGSDASRVADVLAQAGRERADAGTERPRAGEDLAAAERLLEQAQRTGQEDGYRSPVEEALADELADWDPTLTPGSADTSGHGPFVIPPDVPDSAGEGTEPVWDSAVRRRQFAQDLAEQGIPADTIRVRILADGENATHPRDAVLTASTRRGRGLRLPGGRGSQRDRDDQAR